MKKAKRLFSVIITLAMIISIMPMSIMTAEAASINTIFAQAASARRTIIEEGFDGANTTIESLGIKKNADNNADGSFAEIVSGPSGASGKTLHVKRPAGTDASTFFYMPLGETVTNGTLTIEYDLYAATDQIIIGAVCNATWPPAVVTKVSPKIEPYNGNGAWGTTVLDKTKWHTVKLVVKPETSTYDIAIDGDKFATDYAFRSASYNLNNTGITDLAFWLCNGSDIAVEAYVDNVVVTHEVPGSWSKAIDDNFDNGIPSAWTKLLGDKADISVVGKTGDSDTNKVVAIGDDTLSDFDAIEQSFAEAKGQVLVSFDYRISEYNVRSLTLAFDGKNKQGGGVYNAISLITENTTMYYYTTFYNATKANTVTGISNNQWQNIKLLLNIPDNSYSIWLNDTYLGTVPFRYAPDLASINKIRIGAGARPWATTLQPLYFDNMKVYTTDATEPVTVTEGSFEKTFNDGTVGEIPDGIAGNSNTVLAGRTSDTDKDLALKITSLESGENTAYFSFAPAYDNLKVSFDFKVPAGLNATTALRYVMFDSSGNRAMSVSIYDGRIYAIGTTYDGAANTDQWLLANNNFATDAWHSMEFDYDIKAGTFTVAIDGVQNSATYTIRNQKTITNMVKGYFSTWSHGNGSPYSVMIDNIVATTGQETDLTNYGLLQLIAPSPMTVDRVEDIVYGAPIGADIDAFASTISSSSIGSSLIITDKDGNRKSSPDLLEGHDRIVISHPKIDDRVYTVYPNYDIQLRDIIINNNEYSDGSTVLVPGKAKIGAFIYNYTTNAKTLSLYAAVVGNKMYDVEVKNGISVDAKSNKYVEFELDVPDNCTDTDLKIMAFDGTGTITPLCEYESRLVSTSQRISMPTIFSDHMVLQRNADVNIFGLAPTGSEITVQYGDEDAVTGYAANGEFCVQLPMGDASAVGKDLVVTVQNGDEAFEQFTYSDVVVGEVFYGSGQSNMEMKLSNFAGLPSKVTYEPNIRFFDVASINSTEERIDGGDLVDTEYWKVATESTYAQAGATLYSVAWALREMGVIEEDVPIGLIKSARGASSISRWMSKEDVTKSTYGFDDDYLNSAADQNGIRPAAAYHSMAQSVTPYTCKAALWYQGEADTGDANYDQMAKDMINQMREDFGYDIPYYIVQLPGYGAYNNWDMFRPVQWNIQFLVDDAHIVVTNDTGVTNDIHPTDKDVVAKRIVRHMMTKLYSMDNIAYSGPVYKDATVSGNSVTISFDFVNDGLHGGLCSLASDGSLPEFEVSADGSTWYDAAATISGDTVVVSSSSVASPAYVRYGWVNTPVKSLGNQSTDATGTVKLPLAPFSEKIN